jgi:anti-sigma factor RsiW
MSVEFEPMEELERKLREALKRQPAPQSLKRKVMARRNRPQRPARAWFAWRGMAASLVSAVLCILAALSIYGRHDSQRRQAEEARRGEAARQQVLMALRITNHALEHMNQQLAERGSTKGK